MPKNVVYFISGPMTGTEDMGRARFAEAERKLKKYPGVIVLNPACLPLGMPECRYMPICLAMVQQADCVLMLDGWQNSAGSRIEREFALSCGKFIIPEDVIRDVT